jgi:C4-type Zn-finger protein
MTKDEERDEREERKRAAQGISCPRCGCRHYETTHTKRIPHAVRRRHLCRNCKHSFWSVAKIEL